MIFDTPDLYTTNRTNCPYVPVRHIICDWCKVEIGAPEWRLVRRSGDWCAGVEIGVPEWRLVRRNGDWRAGVEIGALEWRLLFKVLS